MDGGFGGWWGCGFWGWWATDNTDGGWRVEDGVEDDVEEFLGEAVEVGLEGGGVGVGVGHGFFVFFSFLLLILGAWGGGSSCFHLLLHDRIIIHGYSKKLETRRW